MGKAEIGVEVRYWGPFYVADGDIPILESDVFGSIWLENDYFSNDADKILHFAYRTEGSDTWHTFENWLLERGIELDLEFEMP